METKICTKCKLEKTVDSFAWKVLNEKRGYHCRECQKIYRDAHYRNDRVRWKKNAIDNRRKRKILFKDFKSNLKCNRCPESHPATLQFHHRDPKEKEFSVSTALSRGWGLDRIKNEIEKCEVLCANCHSKHHWAEYF